MCKMESFFLLLFPKEEEWVNGWQFSVKSKMSEGKEKEEKCKIFDS